MFAPWLPGNAPPCPRAQPTVARNSELGPYQAFVSTSRLHRLRGAPTTCWLCVVDCRPQQRRFGVLHHPDRPLRALLFPSLEARRESH